MSLIAGANISRTPSDEGRNAGPSRADIQTIQPLTSMQTSLLLATLRAKRTGSDPGFLQLRCTLRGELDDQAFERAWHLAFERHAALRTSVHWQSTDRPVQVVSRRVLPSWHVQDWQDAPGQSFDERLAAFLDRDRSLGLDLTRSPVMRLARFRRTADEWVLIWSCHHVLIDGWSGAIVLNEVMLAHDALRQGLDPQLRTARPFADYVNWLQRQDDTEAGTFWHSTLAGVAAAATLPQCSGGGRDDAPQPAAPRTLSTALSAEDTRALEAFARGEHITLGTLAHGAWAVVLAGGSGCADVCFGTTVSGRTAPVPGIEEMVGTFINALPVHAVVEPDMTARHFLNAVQRQLVGLRRFEHTSPARIQEWSGLPGHRRVFETLVVVENFPRARQGGAGALRVEDLQGGITTSAAAALVVVPGDSMRLHLMYDPARLDAAAAQPLLADFAGTLVRLVRHADVPVHVSMSQREAAVTIAPGASAMASGVAAQLPVTGDPLESQLVQILESVLAVNSVGLDDDFFALGGNSLNAARFFDRIERVFGRRLPLATLFEASTVRALAERLRNDGYAARWSSLVAMQPDGHLPPLFCVHSYEGNILIYRDLARHLAPEHPVYGLQSVGMNGARRPLARVEDMAAHYLAEVRSVQPRGPYRLAGICFGISVSFEMAHQLIAQGEEVERLFILDSGFMQQLPMPAAPQRNAAQLFAWRVRAHSRALWLRAGEIPERMRETAHERNLRRVREGNISAWMRYRPRWYPATVTLIRSQGYQQDWHVTTWSELASRLETYVVPGDHSNLIYEPHVEHLAARMRACMQSPVAGVSAGSQA